MKIEVPTNFVYHSLMIVLLQFQPSSQYFNKTMYSSHPIGFPW